MSVGTRLREERLRLAFSQEKLASVASVAKNTAINWEKDASSPTANALIALREAGADVLYILTGRRAVDRPYEEVTQIEDQLAAIERQLLEPEAWRLPGEDDAELEARLLYHRGKDLREILKADEAISNPHLIERAKSLLDIANDPAKLASLRAADVVQRQERREQIKAQLSSWLDGGPYAPGEDAKSLMAMLALEYGAPVKVLVELAVSIHSFAKRQATETAAI